MFKVWREITPFASDNVGAASVFSDTRGLVIFHDMNGSLACTEHFLRLSDTPCFYCATLGKIREADYRLPDPEKFLTEYEQLIEACDPEFVVLLYGPVSSRIELDLDLLASMLAERKGIKVIAVPTPMDKDYSFGISEAFAKIYQSLQVDMLSIRSIILDDEGFDGSESCAMPEKLGLVGLDLLDFCGMRNCQTLRHLFHCAWGCAPTLDDHSRIAAADKCVVMSLSGMETAKRLKCDLGIDYVTLDECDEVRQVVPHLRDMRCRLADELEGLFPERPRMPWMAETEDSESLRILIVGDQVVSHAAARSIEEVLEEVGSSSGKDIAGDIDFALPFGMAEDIELDRDFPIESEQELIDAINCLEYDIVIGPSCLSGLTDVACFVTLENFAMRAA